MKTSSISVDPGRLDQLSTLRPPILVSGVPYLLKSMTNEYIDFKELAALVEEFPGIAGKLISLANSAWSAPKSEVTSTQDACSRLGFGVIRSTSIAIAVSASFSQTKCQSFDAEDYWCSALLTAEVASRLPELSSLNGELEPATARAAGLLHNLGMLWIVDQLPEEVDQVLKRVKRNQPITLQQVLREKLGFDQAQAGGHLASCWNLPGQLVTAMTHYLQSDYQDCYQDIVLITGLAAELVSAGLNEESCPDTDPRIARLEISEKDLATLYSQLGGLVADTRAIAKILI